MYLNSVEGSMNSFETIKFPLYKLAILMALIILQSSKVAHSANEDFLGKDKDSEFYVSPVVNVVISGDNYRHVEEVLEHATMLSKKVPVRNIVIVHKLKGIEHLTQNIDLADDENKRVYGTPGKNTQNPFSAYLKELKLTEFEVKPAQEIINRLGIKSSPTWIIRFEGKEYIYEGYTNISTMFTRDGSFMPQ
jgi:hypothetical protein